MIRLLPHRPALLKRFPRWRADSGHTPLFPEKTRQEYPHLAADLDDLARALAEPFRDADLRAKGLQNSHRRQQVIALLGAVVLSALGAVQALLPDHRWPGVVVTILAAVLLCSSRIARELNTLGDFLTTRTQAERYRALHFEYLSRSGPFAGPDRQAALSSAVIDIDAGREPG